MKKKIKIMLVEDNPEFREVIAFALKNDPNIELESQFGTAEYALNSLQSLSTRKIPDLVLLDLCLPGMSGLDALPYFKKSIPDTKIIILTQSDNKTDILKAISQGASGYLLKKSTIQRVKEGILMVMNGGASLDPDVAKFILDMLAKRPSLQQPEKPLSERELEILTLLGQGLLKKEICEELNISRNTVDTHVRHIYEKLEVQNAPAAIDKAHRYGILPQDNNT
jgi:DNA-binding NarL/FixJ family response regulator